MVNKNITFELYKKADELANSELNRETLDLLKCVQTYRVCPSIEDLLMNKPQLVGQIDEIYKLWRKFDRMSEMELSELAMELINESI